jgi:hypothetical protein
MTDVERLLQDFVEEHRAGGDVDPLAYLDRLEGTDRAELAALIDAYLARAPRREWDPEAYAGSSAERVVESLERSLHGRAGLWPSILPRLRERAKLKRADLVSRLADALGVRDQEQKVAVYYHQMEQGELPSAGVSSRVLEALASIVEQNAEVLQSAGEPLGAGGEAPGEAPVFARKTVAEGEWRYTPLEEDRVVEASRGPAERKEWDEVDRLFLGG